MEPKPFWHLPWVRNHLPVVIVVTSMAIVGTITSLFSFADTPNVAVNFNNTITTLAPGAFSGTISTYGGQNIVTSAKQSNNLRNLNLGIYRIPIQYNNGNPISSAGGGPKNISAYAWIQAIKHIGAQPEIVVGGTADDNFSPQDAQNLVKYFNTPGTNHYSPVHYWLIGNEPDNHGMSLTANNQYCNLYNAAVPLMKQVDPTILVGGPTIEQWSQSELQNFLNCTPSQNVDIVDWHAYAMGGNVLSDAQALNNQAPSYESNFDTLRNMITRRYGAARSAQIQMSVGEYNWSWQFADGYQGGWDGGGNDIRFFEPVAGVWAASVAGHTAKAGARSHQYSDQNGPLGLTFDDSEGAILNHYGRSVNDPMPEYWALAMYTGANLFRSFGTSMVSATSNIPGVEVYASNNKNIVLINKNPGTQELATLGLTGFGSGSADVWQTNPSAPFSAPTKINTLNNITNQLTVALPGYSITTIVLNEGSTSGGGSGGGTQQAPTIANVSASNVSTTGASITWSTDQPSTSQVEYGINTVYGSTTVEDKNMATTHQVALSNLKPNTTYHYRVISTNTSGQTTTSGDAAFTTANNVSSGGGGGGSGSGGGGNTSSNLSIPFHMNVGGGAYTDKNGTLWLADAHFSGGATDDQAAGKSIANTSSPATYQDERYGKNFSYSLPVANGTYNLQLDFAEIYPYCPKPGCRVFNVSVNGTQWLTGLDIAAKVGDYKALTESQLVTVTNGRITLAFNATTGAAQLAGIEVTNPGSTPVPPSAQSGAITGIAGKCLDDKYDQQQNGNIIQLYGCNKTAAQTWTLPGDGTIHLGNSNYCLDVLYSGTTPGTTVQLYGCNGTVAQQWVVNSDGSIENPHAGLCLDDQHSGTSDGNPIWLWTCNGTSAQKWSIPTQ